MKKFTTSYVIVLVTLSIVNICMSAEPNEPNALDVQLTAEKMEQLKQEYKKYKEAVDNFLQANKEAAKNNPYLADVETTLLRISDIRSRGIVGHEDYQKYISNSKDPNEARKLYIQCRIVFYPKATNQMLQDATWAKCLKPAFLSLYRYSYGDKRPGQKEIFLQELRENGYSEFDPNDPNDKRLWDNIQRYIYEQAENLQTKQFELINEKGVPQKVAEYAGFYSFVDSQYEINSFLIAFYTPREVIEAAKEVRKREGILSSIYVQWGKLEHLLTDKNLIVDYSKKGVKGTPWDKVEAFLSGEQTRFHEDEGINNVAILKLTRELAYIIEGECEDILYQREQ